MSWMDDGGFAIQSDSLGTRMSINTTQAHLTIPLSKTDVQRIRRECNRILKQLEKKNQ